MQDIQSKWIDALIEAFKLERSIGYAMVLAEGSKATVERSNDDWRVLSEKYSKLYPRFPKDMYLGVNVGVFLAQYSKNAFLSLAKNNEELAKKWILSRKDTKVLKLPPKRKNWKGKGLGVLRETTVPISTTSNLNILN
jgi:hypothetical protein